MEDSDTAKGTPSARNRRGSIEDKKVETEGSTLLPFAIPTDPAQAQALPFDIHILGDLAGWSSLDAASTDAFPDSSPANDAGVSEDTSKWIPSPGRPPSPFVLFGVAPEEKLTTQKL